MSYAGHTRLAAVIEDAAKLPAFFRRDLLVMWSYRVAFFSDWLNLVVQVFIFALVGRMIDPSVLPSFGAGETTYLEFVVVGIAVTSFMQVAMGRVVNALRNEQMIGTLESLIVSPTAPTTIQLGSVMYDLAYVPIRTFLFLAIVARAFHVELSWSGVGPTVVLLLAFIPFVWGLGMVSAASVLTLRRGAGIVGIWLSALTIGSTTYFPLDVLPGWAQQAVKLNPLTMTLEASREVLLGDAGWQAIWSPMLIVSIFAVVSLVAGVVSFRGALRRERRRGTLGLY